MDSFVRVSTNFIGYFVLKLDSSKLYLLAAINRRVRLRSKWNWARLLCLYEFLMPFTPLPSRASPRQAKYALIRNGMKLMAIIFHISTTCKPSRWKSIFDIRRTEYKMPDSPSATTSSMQRIKSRPHFHTSTPCKVNIYYLTPSSAKHPPALKSRSTVPHFDGR